VEDKMREIEVKFEIKDIRAIRRKIKRIGAKYRGKQLHLDIWFDTKSGALKKKKIGLRLRRQNGKALLTLKTSQVIDRSMREAEETEIQVKNFEKAKEVLKKIGFQERTLVQKEREVWQKKGVEFVLDKVKDLGTFLELEGSRRKDIEEAIIGLENASRIVAHYVRLLEEQGKG
jgi:adenylate cyclase class 2